MVVGEPGLAPVVREVSLRSTRTHDLAGRLAIRCDCAGFWSRFELDRAGPRTRLHVDVIIGLRWTFP